MVVPSNRHRASEYNVQSRVLILVYCTSQTRKLNSEVWFEILVLNYHSELLILSNSNTVTPTKHDLGTHHTGQHKKQISFFFYGLLSGTISRASNARMIHELERSGNNIIKV